MINAGKYLGKVLDYGIGKTKDGEPNIMLMFGFKDSSGVDQDLIWRGSLKEGKAREITIDALLILGLVGNDLSLLAHGNGSGVLNQEKEVQLVVEHETYNGKTFAKVRYINEVGGGAFKEKMGKDEAITKLGGLNLGGDVFARREAKGYKDKAPAPLPAVGEQATLSPDDIMF